MTDYELYGMAKKYKELKARALALDEELAAVENAIKAHLGDIEDQTVEDCRIRWKRYRTNRFDVKSFQADAPVLYEKYLISSEARRFSIT